MQRENVQTSSHFKTRLFLDKSNNGELIFFFHVINIECFVLYIVDLPLLNIVHCLILFTVWLCTLHGFVHCLILYIAWFCTLFGGSENKKFQWECQVGVENHILVKKSKTRLRSKSSISDFRTNKILALAFKWQINTKSKKHNFHQTKSLKLIEMSFAFACYVGYCATVYLYYFK